MKEKKVKRETICLSINGYIYTLVKLNKAEIHFRDCRPPNFLGYFGFALQSCTKLKRTK